MKWETARLGELIDVKHGYAFKGESFVDSGDLVLLTPGNCHETGGLKLRADKEKFYSGEFPDDYLLHQGDMLIVMTDLVGAAPVLGGAFLVPENDRYLHNQRLGLITVTDESRLDKGFLYWLLNSHDYRAQVRGSASGATVRHTSPGRVKNVIVRLPSDLAYQQEVAQGLFAYDDLIDNNRRRIKLLEDSVRLLFDEWFVRLRPPGSGGQSQHGSLPAGWRWGRCTDMVAVNPKVRTAKDTELWYVPMSALSQVGMTVDKADFERRTEHTAVRFERGDTLFARITPCLENGKTGYVYFLAEGEIACGSTEFVVLRGKTVSSFFTYCLARNQTFRDSAVKSMIGSSGRQRVQPSAFEKFELAIPPESLLSHFDVVAADCFEQVANLAGQNERLIKARDLLLPRLMSGDLAV